MASPPGDPSPFAAAEAQMYADLGDSDSQTSSSFIVGSPVQISQICPWRTPRFNDRECSRFFDCPSHIVERSLSDDGSVQEDDTHDLDNTTTGSVDPADQDEQNTANPGALLEPVQPDEEHIPNTQQPSIPEPDEQGEGVEEQDEETEEASPRGDPPTETIEPAAPAQYTSGLLDVSDLRDAVPALEMTLTQDEPGSSSQALSSGELRQASMSDDNSGDGIGVRTEGDAAFSGLPEPRRVRTPVSRERMDAPLPSPRRERTPSESLPPLPQPPRSEVEGNPVSEWSVPRWQPDAEVTYCPICRTQFSFFVRKHHCRKCGRVVCNSCSPHRIIIPYQYIVRPPGSEVGVSQSLLIDGLGAGYFDMNSMSGGERVRLCNPCVPDPNTAPPQSPNTPAAMSPRSTHQRSRSSAAGAYGVLPPTNRHGAIFAPVPGGDPYQYLSSRTRSITMAGPVSNSAHGTSSRRARSGTHQTPIERLLSGGASSSSYPNRYSSLGDVASSSRQRALPPTPQIAEEDECPICHRELPSRSLSNFESLRESHIASCIQSHSTYGTPRGGEEGDASPAAPRRTGMYTYPATEKDCIDDAECTICLEEFTVGVPMARLECLCRFHRSCISAWFINHPGRCPVHQHDGFGY